MNRLQRFVLPGIIAIASTLPASHVSYAQQLTDAQAQALLQTLATQQSGAAALSTAQNQMLMQYLLSKQTSTAGKTAVGAAQSQMMLQQLNGGAQRLPGGVASSLLTQPSIAPANAPAGQAALAEKKPGVIRLGIVMPKSQLGQGPAAGEPLRGMLLQYLVGPTVEVTSIAALLPEQIEAESKAKSCDFLVFSSIGQKKASGGFGLLKNASSMANMLPMVGMMNGMSGVVAATTAATAASQAATLSSSVKAKSDVTLDFYVTAAGNATPVLSNSLKAKAAADGEDVISPLVAQEASAVMTQISKK